MPTCKQRASRYSRVVLKLSGEALRSPRCRRSIEPDVLSNVCIQIRDAIRESGAQIAIVVGGGNIFRGGAGEAPGVNRDVGDAMGMLATAINALAMESVMQKAGLDVCVQSAIEMTRISEPFNRARAIERLEKGGVVIFAAGTGNPYFTTDTAAALRACQIGADVLLKATKVDGVYSADPKKHPSAVRYSRLRYADALEKNLRVMDSTAFSMCMENNIPIVVFDFFKRNNLRRVLAGEDVGTCVCA